MAFRTATFDTWPGFRESLGLGAPLPGGDENYAFFELVRAGHSIRYSPDAVVRHPHPNSADELAARRALVLEHALAYGMLLLLEEPDHRLQLIRLAWRRVAGGVTSQGRATGSSATVRLPFWRKARAVGRAPLVCFRCRRLSRRQHRFGTRSPGSTSASPTGPADAGR
jgi:hypothetical protein